MGPDSGNSFSSGILGVNALPGFWLELDQHNVAVGQAFAGADGGHRAVHEKCLDRVVHRGRPRKAFPAALAANGAARGAIDSDTVRTRILQARRPSQTVL